MKQSRPLLADRILQLDDWFFRDNGGAGDTARAVMRLARDMLVKPSPNHAPNPSSEFRPFIDRFVFSDQDYARLNAFCVDDSAVNQALLANGRPPLPNCWIEAGWHGYLIKDDGVVCYGRTGDNKDYVAPIFVAPDFWCDEAGDEMPIWRYGDTFNRHEVMVLIHDLMRLTSVITNPRIAVANRVIRKTNDDATQRAFALRRAQRGRPVYSFNRVELVAPKLCEFRGVLVEAASLAGRRGHMVVGHWRLIDNRLEPYWVWIEGHERGDRELGWIAKERMIHLAPIERHGFISPSFSGFKGQRVKAA